MSWMSLAGWVEGDPGSQNPCSEEGAISPTRNPNSLPAHGSPGMSWTQLLPPAASSRTLICRLPRLAGAQVGEKKGLPAELNTFSLKRLSSRAQTSSQAYLGSERLLTGFRPHSKPWVKWVLGLIPSRPSPGLSPLA